MFCEKCGFEYTGEYCPVCADNKPGEVKAKNSPSTLGLIGMILGIASFMVGSPFDIGGLVCSIIAIKQDKKDPYATAGLISSAIHLGMNVFSAISSIVMLILGIMCYILFMMFVIGGYVVTA